MTMGAAWTRARARLSPYRAQLRFCLRMTAAASLAFALAQIWNITLNGLWSVLTAVVVTQMSVGGSLHATTEYVLGTIGGAIYAATIGVLIPHTTTLALAGVLALTIAPLAFAAAVNPSFRSARASFSSSPAAAQAKGGGARSLQFRDRGGPQRGADARALARWGRTTLHARLRTRADAPGLCRS